MKGILVLGIVLLISTVFGIGTASAAECGGPVACSCGDTITEDTILTEDLLNCSGNGLIIGVSGVTLDCNGHSIEGVGVGASSGIYVNHKSYTVINNCHVTDFYRGLYLYFSSFSTVENNFIDNTYYGLRLYTSRNVTIDGNDFTGSTHGVFTTSQGLTPAPDIIITNNNFETTGDSVFSGARYSNNMVIKYNTFSASSGYGIKFYSAYAGTDNLTITNNVLSGNGVYLRNIRDSLVSDNVVSGGTYGITLHTSQNISVESNDVTDSTHGVYIVSQGVIPAPDNKITNNNLATSSDAIFAGARFNNNMEIKYNTISASSGYGIKFNSYYAGTDNIAITNNVLTGNGIYLTNIRDSLVSDNIISNAVYGIRLYTSQNILIENNNVTNSTHGVYLGVKGTLSSEDLKIINNNLETSSNAISTSGAGRHYDNFEATGNVISTTSGYGIYFYPAYLGTDNVKIYNNIFYSTNGIFLRNLANSSVEDNIIMEGNYGLYIRDSSNTNVTENDLILNNYGLYFYNSDTTNVYHNNIFNNTILQAYSNRGIELSYNQEGNYWGRDSGPCFVAGVDSNALSVVDSYCYSIEDEWEAGTTIDDLINVVEAMNLHQGIENGLDAKLDAALDALNALNADQRQDAVNKLQAFINAVEAQRGNKITNEQADLLIDMVNNIITQISQA